MHPGAPADKASQAEIVYLRQSRIAHAPMLRVDLLGGVTSPDPHIDRPNLVFTSYTTPLHRQCTRAALTSARLPAPLRTVIQYSQDIAPLVR
jgi:hypothetical protein